MHTYAPLLGLALFVASLPAQEPTPDPYGHSRHGAEFDEGPRQAAWLMPGLSDQVHFPIVGLSEEAQRFFDQGVCQQHGFWYFEAERSFRQVAKLQPDCAMAYWGMVMANTENWKRAAGFAAQAVQRSAKLPEREKLYIDAIATLYQIDDAQKTELQSGDKERIEKARLAVVGKTERDEKQLHRNFVRGLEAVVAAFPEDIEAKAFLAVQLWRNADVGLEITSHGAVDALLQQVFDKAPMHPCHHYRIHLWNHEKAERALKSAALNGASAPGIAHEWHMSGHIYYELNRNAEAAWQQEASGRVDHAQMARNRVMPYEIHNYGHNQEWLCRSLSHVGRVHEALDLAKNMAELPRHPKFNKLDANEDIAGYARERLVDVCEDHELWDEALLLCRDGHLEHGEDLKGEVVRLGLLGRALFRLGRLDEAQRAIADADLLLGKARAARAAAVDKAEDEAIAKKEDREKADKAMDDARRDRTDVVRAVRNLQLELHGEQLLAAGDAKGALAEFLQVKNFPKTLLADAHVAAGEPDKAIELLEKGVKEHPGRLPTGGRLLLAYHAAKQAAAKQPDAGKPAASEPAASQPAATQPAATQPAASKPDYEARIVELIAQLPKGTTHTDRPDRTRFTARLQGLLPAGTWDVPANEAVGETAGFGPDFGPRPSLDSLGPFRWSPVAAAGFDLPCADGGRATLSKGKPQLVVFYLGFGCLHCVQQLEALSPKAKAFADAGIQIVAIGNETLAKTQDNVAALGDKKFTFPLLADPELAAFKAWRCYDDFENLPLHGTFLIDGDGKIRWQDISFEPFTQVDWLLAESQRLLALPANTGSK